MTTTRHTAAVSEPHRKLARKMDDWAPYGLCKDDTRFSDDDMVLKRPHVLAAVCNAGGPEGVPCPVSVECLTHAMLWPEPDGIWGGKNIDQRRRIRDSKREAARKERNRSMK